MTTPLSINYTKLDPNKIYHIAVEVSDMSVSDTTNHLVKVKNLFESYGISAIYSATVNGIHSITITDLHMFKEENQ